MLIFSFGYPHLNFYLLIIVYQKLNSIIVWTFESDCCICCVADTQTLIVTTQKSNGEECTKHSLPLSLESLSTNWRYLADLWSQKVSKNSARQNAY